MSGDLSYTHCEMATTDFVNDFKSLSLCQTEYSYSITIQRLINYFNQATSNGHQLNMPYAMAFVENFYRIIPICEKKLSENSENSRQTNAFLETFISTFDSLCIFDLFLAIKDSNRVEFIFQKYVPFLKQSYFTDEIIYDNLIHCLLPIIGCSSLLVQASGQNFPESLLSNLLEFVKKNLHCERRENLIHNILVLIKAFSKSAALVPMVIRCEWPNACIELLKTPGSRPVFKIDFLLCLILQKVARHAAGVKALNQLSCIKAMDESKEQIKRDHNEEEFSTINFIQNITYILLLEDDEIKRNSVLGDKLVSDILEQISSYILKASQDRLFVYKGCHISEFLCALSKLFVRDDLLTTCLNKNCELFDCLSELLIKFTTLDGDIARVQKLYNDEALLTLANLLWSVSFHKPYHQKFKSNTKLMQTLSNLATSSLLYKNTQIKRMPNDIASLKKSAECILWNLKSQNLILSKEKCNEQPLIMISYSHSDSKFCHELVDQLSPNVPVWVDYKQAQANLAHSDDLWEEIAGAMETSTIIVVVVSKEYYESKSCRQELSYATDTLKKQIVPVYAPNQKYKANGWLGIRIAGQKYIHFGRKPFSDALNELLSTISLDQKSIITPKYSHQPISEEPNKQENILESWTSTNIRKWFVDNHIHQDLVTLYADQFRTGTSLIIYAYHLKQFYRNEYIQILANYQKTFPGKNLRTVDFVTFVDAFLRLRLEYDPQSKLEDALEKIGGNQLPTMMKILSEGITWL